MAVAAIQQAELGLKLSTKGTRKREFLAQMERALPWAAVRQAPAALACLQHQALELLAGVDSVQGQGLDLQGCRE